jgi:superfamily II DNA or RNA helicase
MTNATSAPRELRDYQAEDMANVLAEWDKGINRTALVHATGLGKTDIIAKLATDEIRNNPNGQVIIIAHMGKALDQAAQRCALYAPDIPVGRVQAERNEVDCPIITASVQTLRNPKRMAQCRKPTMLIIDECHHAQADSYWDIMEWAGCFEANGTRMLGVTATLIRGDGRKFSGLFTSVAAVRTIEWGINNGPNGPVDPDDPTDVGWLVRPHGRVIRLRRGLDHIRAIGGDLSASGLSPIIEQDAEAIVSAWLDEADNRITAAFAPTVDSAYALTDAFRAAGVAVELVIGSTEHEDRELIYKRLAAGQTRVLVNVGVATESFDCPEISCVLIARITQSPGLYIQMTGRGLRPCPRIGKIDCLVLDVVGITRKYKLMTLVDMYPDARRAATPGLGERIQRRWWHRVRYEDTEVLPEQRSGVLASAWRRLRKSLW